MTEKRSMQMRKRSFYLWRLAIFLPFVIGVFGFLKSGLPLIKATYASFCLYFVSVFSTASNPLIEIARWTAPIFLLSGIVWSLRSVFFMFRNIYLSIDRNATVIYYDEAEADNAMLLSEDIKKSFTEMYVPGKPIKFYNDVPNQIVMFSDDFDNLEFISKHRKALEKKNVCVQITNIDSSLLDSSTFRYFNVTEITATKYWADYPLYYVLHKGQNEIDVAIIGSNEFAEKIILSALLYNIFCDEQVIRYHVFGNQEELRFVLNNSSLMNNDKVIFYDDSWHNYREILSGCERIIYTDMDYDPLETLIYSFTNIPIYFYSDYNDNINEYFLRKNIYNFGSSKIVYTKDNILGDGLYQYARELNYLAVTGGVQPEGVDIDQFKDEEWRKLDGFIQSYFKSCVDFHLQFAQTGFVPEMSQEGIRKLAKIEHIRQCRFCFINGWHYGASDIKDRYNIRTHESRILVPFDELSEDVLAVKLRNAEFLLKENNKKVEYV